MPVSVANLLQDAGVRIQATEHPDTDPRHGKAVKLTQALVDDAVKACGIQDLAEYLRGRQIISSHKLSSEFPGSKAAAIFITVLEAADRDWQKKQAVVYHEDQVVVVERPEAEVAQQLHHALEAAKAEKAAKSAKAPKAGKADAPAKSARAPRASKAKPDAAAAPDAEKPKRAPRKPKAKE